MTDLSKVSSIGGAVPNLFLATSILILLAFFSIVPGLANEPWARLPDGRVVVEVFRERLAFHPDDAAFVSFLRNNNAGGYELLTLAEAIADPRNACTFFSGPRPNHLGVDLILNIYRQNPDAHDRSFLGQFKWSELPQSGGDDRLHISIIPSNEPMKGATTWARPHQRYQVPPMEYFP